jgi:hypothetical protein
MQLPYIQTVTNATSPSDADMISSHFIQELLDERWTVNNDLNAHSILDSNEIDALLYDICTE